jgi:hypothetical protein
VRWGNSHSLLYDLGEPPQTVFAAVSTFSFVPWAFVKHGSLVRSQGYHNARECVRSKLLFDKAGFWLERRLDL